VVSRIQQIDGLTLDAPGGAFYAFIGCDHFIGASTPNGTTIKDDTQFTQYLLEDAKVAAVAGSAYGLSPFFRLSTATADDILNQAIDRIADSVAKLTLNKTD
jgi:aspartate aminotransferase